MNNKTIAVKSGNLIDDKYLVIEELGKGGMGKVFKVSRNKKQYALKMCMLTDKNSILRFRREVRLMKTIEHVNVIEVIDSRLTGKSPYFVMPLCKFSIAEKLERLKSKPEFALRVLKQVCTGVNAIHLSGVVHRDIKPHNILISETNRIKISDLGLGKFSKRDTKPLTSSNDHMGTAGYMPPEFYQKGGTKNADIRSDIYQLGKLIYTIVSGEPPLHVKKDLLSGGLQFIVDKCISDDPEDRYQSVNALKTSLNNYLRSLDPENNPVSAYDSYIDIAITNLRNNEYEEENIERIVHSVVGFKGDPEIFFKQSKKIPKGIFEIIASDYPTLCRAFIKAYSPTIEKYFMQSNSDFAESEVVASILKTIFNNTRILAVRNSALKTTLIASVETNRYNAMGVFDSMLKSISKDQEALSIAEMLRDNIKYYKEVADRIPKSKLHPYFQTIQEKILKMKNNNWKIRNDDW